MTGLTSKQSRVLRFVMATVLQSGSAPTRAEICRHMGLKNDASVLCHLNALQAKGFIYREEFLFRGIRVLKNPEGHPVQLRFEEVAH